MNTGLALYKQISRKLENDILAGKLPPGCRIPSVRELAAQYQVNPNTVQRAVQEVKHLGLLISLHGKGTAVIKDTDIISRLLGKRCENIISAFLVQMNELGYSHEQVVKLLQEEN